MSASSDDSDFGGRFARQFFNSDCPNVTSTPDNSFCESGYESFHQVYNKLIDINNNNTTPNITDNLNNINNHSHNCSTGNNSDASSSNINDSNNNSIILSVTTTIPTDCNNNHTSTNNSNHNIINNNSNTNTTKININNNIANQSTILRTQQSDLNVNVIQRQQRSNSLFTTAPAVANVLNAKNPWSTQGLQDVYQRFNNADKIERAATLHRTAASYSEPQYTWSGQLPSRSHKNPVYSCKVFLGGVPWDIDEQGLIDTFGRFGPLRVQWPPSKDVRQQQGQERKAGYVYIIYDTERCVKALLQACTQDFGAGSHPERYFYQLSSRRMRFKEVQVIPWALADSNYIRNQSGRPDINRTVFVGALHGMMTAEGLARIMNDLFGGVAYVGIDTDKHKYPLGSSRCAFTNQKSYMKAISAGFIEVKSPQFCKKIQVDPYIILSDCSTCHVQSGHLFCRDCLRYFCKTCWNWRHSSESIIGRMHRPLMRNKRDN